MEYWEELWRLHGDTIDHTIRMNTEIGKVVCKVIVSYQRCGKHICRSHPPKHIIGKSICFYPPFLSETCPFLSYSTWPRTWKGKSVFKHLDSHHPGFNSPSHSSLQPDRVRVPLSPTTILIQVVCCADPAAIIPQSTLISIDLQAECDCAQCHFQYASLRTHREHENLWFLRFLGYKRDGFSEVSKYNGDWGR